MWTDKTRDPMKNPLHPSLPNSNLPIIRTPPIQYQCMSGGRCSIRAFGGGWGGRGG